MRLCFTLFVLLFTQLFFNLAHAAPNAGINADQRKSQSSTAKAGDRRKRKPLKEVLKITKKSKPVTEQKISRHSTDKPKELVAEKTSNKKLHSLHVAEANEPAVEKSDIKKPHSKSSVKVAKELSVEKHTVKKLHPMPSAKKIAKFTPPKKGYKKGYGRHRMNGRATLDLIANDQPIIMSDSHKKRYQHAKLTAMNKLMSQMGKPYRWGGMSPNTGFDCSGLIYYAYKDVVRIHMPRTANEMFHLRDAAPVKKDDLESGDLVFFHITNRGAADHVGVYLGNGRFIESPRTGRDIRISYLNEDYWQDHYVGARRVVTPKNIR